MSASRKNPGLAAVLSLLIPGVGQFYNGDFWRGLFWLIVTPGLWIGSGGLLGWICHVIAAITAYTRAERFNRLAGPIVLTILTAMVGSMAFGSQAVPPGQWLDRPLAGWNQPETGVPKAPAAAESREALMKRCQITLLRSTPAERALADAGWIPFLNFDQTLVAGDVEIVDGMSAADGMCRPGGYNVFVFVGGRFAGTLSPTLMTSRGDGSSGAVRLVAGDGVTSDFARYTSADPLCCPSSHVTVRYRIDRSGPLPMVVPTELRKRQ